MNIPEIMTYLHIPKGTRKEVQDKLCRKLKDDLENGQKKKSESTSGARHHTTLPRPRVGPNPPTEDMNTKAITEEDDIIDPGEVGAVGKPVAGGKKETRPTGQGRPVEEMNTKTKTVGWDDAKSGTRVCANIVILDFDQNDVNYDKLRQHVSSLLDIEVMDVYAPKRHPRYADNTDVIRMNNTELPIVFFRGPMRGGSDHLYALPKNVRGNDVLLQYVSSSIKHAAVTIDDEISIDTLPFRVTVSGDDLQWHGTKFRMREDDIKDVKSVLEGKKEGSSIVDKYRRGIYNRLGWDKLADHIKDEKKKYRAKMDESIDEINNKIREHGVIMDKQLKTKLATYDVIAPMKTGRQQVLDRHFILDR